MKKVFRVTLISLSILIALILGLQLFASLLLPKMIRHRIITEVDRASQGLYALNIDKVTVNIFQMSVGIHHAQLNIQIKDTTYINAYPHPLWQGTIDEAEVSGIKLLEFFRNKK